MMKNRKYNLVPYEVIEKAISGDTGSLQYRNGTVQSLHRQTKQRKHRYERAVKRKTAYSDFEVPNGLSARRVNSKDKKCVRKRLLQVYSGRIFCALFFEMGHL